MTLTPTYGLSLGKHFKMPYPQLLPLIQEAGFSSVSPIWCAPEVLEEISTVAKDTGLTLQSLHSAFQHIPAIWGEDAEAAALAMTELNQSLENCNRFEIPVMVAHVWKGFEVPFQKTAIGLARFETIVDRARALGVRVALENTEGIDALYTLMEHFNGEDTVGFCWDTGHSLCYNPGEPLTEKLGDRLIMTHLNDNLGISDPTGRTFWTDDLHLFPFDGKNDWQDICAQLGKCAPQSCLNLELTTLSKPNRHENDHYAQMDTATYLKEAAQRARRILRLMA